MAPMQVPVTFETLSWRRSKVSFESLLSQINDILFLGLWLGELTT